VLPAIDTVPATSISNGFFSSERKILELLLERELELDEILELESELELSELEEIELLEDDILDDGLSCHAISLLLLFVNNYYTPALGVGYNLYCFSTFKVEFELGAVLSKGAELE
jgi:hypothetical protein